MAAPNLDGAMIGSTMVQKKSQAKASDLTVLQTITACAKTKKTVSLVARVTIGHTQIGAPNLRIQAPAAFPSLMELTGAAQTSQLVTACHRNTLPLLGWKMLASCMT